MNNYDDYYTECMAGVGLGFLIAIAIKFYIALFVITKDDRRIRFHKVKEFMIKVFTSAKQVYCKLKSFVKKELETIIND